MALLEVKNLHKSFGNLSVLNGVDFKLESGEVMSIIGSSGNGKTTLLRCLNFLEIPNEGSIYVNDELIFDASCKYDDKTLRENRLNFGLVFQSFNLFPQYTVLKNITLAMDIRAKELAKRDKSIDLKQALEENKQNAVELLEEVGLGDRIDYYPCQLSGGQSQRVAIARALALDPAILCFDEPTSALDPELTGEVLRVIKSLKNNNRAMIIVTHEMAFAQEVSDKILFMLDGRVEEFGTPEEVFDKSNNENVKAFLSGFSQNY